MVYLDLLSPSAAPTARQQPVQAENPTPRGVGSTPTVLHFRLSGAKLLPLGPKWHCSAPQPLCSSLSSHHPPRQMLRALNSAATPSLCMNRTASSSLSIGFPPPSTRYFHFYIRFAPIEPASVAPSVPPPTHQRPQHLPRRSKRRNEPICQHAAKRVRASSSFVHPLRDVPLVYTTETIYTIYTINE